MAIARAKGYLTYFLLDIPYEVLYMRDNSEFVAVDESYLQFYLALFFLFFWFYI